MDWLRPLLLDKGEIATSVLILALVVASGLVLGGVRFRGIRLGVAGVLFSGLAFGHFGLTINPTVLDFARELMPDDFEEICRIFSRRGAYQNFRALLTRRKALDRWYEHEANATRKALRDWCGLNEIEVTG